MENNKHPLNPFTKFCERPEIKEKVKDSTPFDRQKHFNKLYDEWKSKNIEEYNKLFDEYHDEIRAWRNLTCNYW